MALKYTDLEDLNADYVSLNNFNDSLAKLVENDEDLILNLKNRPDVWECKWYNDQQIPGYQIGAAVWIGTEDPQQFVKSRFDEIEHIVLNSQYRGQYVQISSDSEKVMAMFLNICNGTGGYKRLYYLGDPKQHAQVRVCVSATDSATNTNYDLPTAKTWKDSFRLSSIENYQNIMLSAATSSIVDNLSTHIKNYHLSSSVSLKQLTSNYLLNDFSNITLKQVMNTHNIMNRGKELVGFDSISKFVHTQDSNGTRWFRLWSSGFLEHGGTVKCGQNSTVNVNLNWNYGTNNSKTAITYDYPIKYDGFYATGEFPYVDGNKKQISQDNIGDQQTYSIIINPVVTGNGKMVHEKIEIFNITNTGFQMANQNSKCQRFSYSTAGFITSPTMRRLGL